MFDQPNSIYDGYEYLEDISVDPELICSICHLPFKDPRSTPCDDTFCLECISRWIQTQNRSCPVCRRSLSIDELTQVNRPIRNMLDRIRVKCITCGQSGLPRGNFKEHVEKTCPKMQILCPSADIKCPWEGQRDQLDEHLSNCAFHSLRYIITPLMTENEQLYELISKFRSDNQQLREQTGHLTIQANKYQREIQDLNQQIAQLRTQLQNQQIKEQERHKTSIFNEIINSNKNMQMATNGISLLKGVWEYIDGENFDSFMKEIGVGMATRLLTKGLKLRLIIDEIANEWIVRFESTIKVIEYKFVLGVEFNETTFDGREVKSIVTFSANKWIHQMLDKNGEKSVIIRYVDQNDMQIVEMECGIVKARRWYKRAT
ncbi:unnamed protein product [Adineta ricciae]|uniref:RING-type domain-containing protein n=1 Tax=Adineta ricciae TaxID=249248 RepID=A0A816DKQ4_ADIRI|nr:unnamed protein product [Adineta ricciae]